MTKQQLEYFLSAAEFCNLSKAAAYHYVSIPTFTRHINDLEEELSTKLFVRTNRGLVITEAGALFHPVARRTLDLMYDYNDLILERELMVGNPLDRFVIGYYPFGQMFVHFTQLIDRYLSVWIKKPCSLRCVRTGQMTRMVLEGTLDVGAVSKPQIEKHGDAFESRLFFRSRCVLLVDKDHELATRDNISIAELKENYADYSLYLPVEGRLENLKDHKIQDKEDIREICRHYLDLLPELAAESIDARRNRKHRMIIGTSDLMRPEIQNKHIIEIENGCVTNEVRLFWRKDNDSESIRRFKEALDFADIK